MASLYIRARSPFWWLKYKKEGKWICESTGLRVESEEETRQADVIRAQWALKEAKDTGREQRRYSWQWAEDWIEAHCKSPKTLAVYRRHWSHIQHWMKCAGIHAPSDITFRHGHEYVAFRTGKRSGHKVCGKNTALLEAKLLGMILRQAALRGEIASNPIHRLGISKVEPDPKRDLSDAEIERCLRGLLKKDEAGNYVEDEWIRISFPIGLHTGCRLLETRIRLSLVDLDRMTITFETPKGGRNKAFTRPLPEAIKPILEKLKKEGREYTHEFPFQPSRWYQHFFKRVEVENISFHCLRVTYVTRLHREGVPLAAAMRLVNHSSVIVHRIYQRLNVEDVRPYASVPLFSTTLQNLTAE